MSTSPRTTDGTLVGEGCSAACACGVSASSICGDTTTRQPGAPTPSGGAAAAANVAATSSSRAAVAGRGMFFLGRALVGWREGENI